MVISKVKPGFSLRGNLGTPTNAAETFIRLSLAPEGSGRTATLVNAEEDVERQVYQFEYDVDRGERGPPLKAISLIAVQNSDNLLTLTVVAPLQEWPSTGDRTSIATTRPSASSRQMISDGSGASSSAAYQRRSASSLSRTSRNCSCFTTHPRR